MLCVALAKSFLLQHKQKISTEENKNTKTKLEQFRLAASSIMLNIYFLANHENDAKIFAHRQKMNKVYLNQ